MNKELVVVLGMHRSGTSVLTKGIAELGYFVGETLPASADNKKGYFENADIVHLNDLILDELCLDWMTRDTISFNRCEVFLPLLIEKFENTAFEIIENLFSNSNKCVIKDPRVSILIPFWEYVFNKLNIKYKYVLAIRMPSEVSKSFVARKNGSYEEGIKLWLNYNAIILKNLRNQVLVVNYKDVLSKTEEMMFNLCHWLNVNKDEYINNIKEYSNKFVEKELNNQTGVSEKNNHLVEKMYEFLDTDYLTFESINTFLNSYQDEINKFCLEEEILIDGKFAQLYVDIKNGFSEEDSIKVALSGTHKQKLNVSLSKFGFIKNLRFDPMEDECIVILKSIYKRDTEEKIAVDITNSIYKNDNIFFLPKDGQFYFNNINSVVDELVLEFEYFKMDKISAKLNMKIFKDNQIQSLNKSHENIIIFKDLHILNIENILVEKDSIIENNYKDIAEKDRTIENNYKDIAEKDRTIEENYKAISSKDKVIAEKDREIEETTKMLISKDESLKLLQDEIKINQQIILEHFIASINIAREKKAFKYTFLIPFIFIKTMFFYILGKESDRNYLRAKKVISKKGRFDVDYYLSQTKDANIHRKNAFTHYVKHGYKANLSPNGFFDVAKYHAENGDIREHNVEPYSHFLNYGIAEGRYASVDILTTFRCYSKGKLKKFKLMKYCYGIFKFNTYDANYYKLAYPETCYRKTYRLGKKLRFIKPLSKALMHPITDYVFYGVFEGKELVKTFNSTKYLSNNKDVLMGGINPLLHYVTHGINENRVGVFEVENEDRFETEYIIERKDSFEFIVFVKSGVNFDNDKFNSTIENLKTQAYKNLSIVILDENGDFNRTDLNLPKVKEVREYLNTNQNAYFTILNAGDTISNNILSYLDHTLSLEECNIIFGDEVLLRDNGERLKCLFKDGIASTITYEQLGEAVFIKVSSFIESKFNLVNYIKNIINYNSGLKYVNKVTHYKYFNEQIFVKKKIKPIAFYLPQFHAIPENDAWWGEGFTEWTNVVKGEPMYDGHNQPRVPGELGYYNLVKDEDILHKQTELAKEYGVYGFCFYYYWFEGKRLLEKPMDRFLADKTIDFPFCICWANETWSRRWTGEESEVLIKQVHNEKTDVEFIYDVLDLFRDERYIRINGKPMLLVYRPSLFVDFSETMKVWNDICVQEGIGNIEIVLVQSFGLQDPSEYGANYAVEFPPHNTDRDVLTSVVENLVDGFEGKVYDYVTTVENEMRKPTREYNVFKSCMLSWDNTARKGKNADSFWGCDGEQYKAWLEGISDYTYRNNKDYEQFVFINAWNEWAEGTYLEPDEKNGRLFLEKTKEVMDLYREADEAIEDDLISIVVPSYNTSKYIVDALDSIVYQTYKNLELVVIDDCSKDNSVEILENYFKRSYVKNRFVNLVFKARDKNHGAHYTINEGLELAKGKWLTVLNADDMFECNRFEKIMKAVKLENTEFVFTAYDIIDGEGNKLNNKEAQVFYGMQDNIDKFKQLSYSILYHNTAVSTGNMVFTRRLYDQIGGFMHYKYIHDWDFILQATLICEPIRVTSTKYLYRLHDTNSFRDLGDVVEEETNLVFERYFDKLVNNCENRKVSEQEVIDIIKIKGFTNLLNIYKKVK